MHRIITWTLNNPNLSVVIVFAVLGIFGLVFQNSTGIGGEGSGYNENEYGEGGGTGSGKDSIGAQSSSSQAILYENGDTCSITYYNPQGKRTKYIQKDENGDTVRLYETYYTDSGQIDKKTEYYENKKASSRTRNVNDEFDGEQILYYKNGNIKLKRTYSVGKEIEAFFYNEDGKLIKIETNL